MKKNDFLGKMRSKGTALSVGVVFYLAAVLLSACGKDSEEHENEAYMETYEENDRDSQTGMETGLEDMGNVPDGEISNDQEEQLAGLGDFEGYENSLEGRLKEDFEAGQLTADEYVKNYLYGIYDTSLLGEEYASLDKSGMGCAHPEKLITEFMDELSDETLKYYLDKKTLAGITFLTDEEMKESRAFSVRDLFSITAYAEQEADVTNLNKVLVSENENFVVWYNASVSEATAKEIADSLEQTVEKYNRLFGVKFEKNVRNLGEWPNYEHQVKILEENGLSEYLLHDTIQVYIIDFLNKDLAAQYNAVSDEYSMIFMRLGISEARNSPSLPYIIVRPSSTREMDYLKQVIHHELFHHYQHVIFDDRYIGKELANDMGTEAAADVASALVTEVEGNNGWLNEMSAQSCHLPNAVLSDKFLAKTDQDNVGHFFMSYFWRYYKSVDSSYGNNVNILKNSAYAENFRSYLQESSTLEERQRAELSYMYDVAMEYFPSKNLVYSDNFESGLLIANTFDMEETDQYTSIEIPLYPTGFVCHAFEQDPGYYYKYVIDVEQKSPDVVFYLMAKNAVGDMVVLDQFAGDAPGKMVSFETYSDEGMYERNDNRFQTFYLLAGNSSIVDSSSFSYTITRQDREKTIDDYLEESIEAEREKESIAESIAIETAKEAAQTAQSAAGEALEPGEVKPGIITLAAPKPDWEYDWIYTSSYYDKHGNVYKLVTTWVYSEQGMGQIESDFDTRKNYMDNYSEVVMDGNTITAVASEEELKRYYGFDIEGYNDYQNLLERMEHPEWSGYDGAYYTTDFVPAL